MRIRISRESDVPIREQLVAQLQFLIATRELKPGEALPSVRALATRLKIHHNTVSQAYRELVASDLLVGKRGSKMVVRSLEQPLRPPAVEDLDDLINETIEAARRNGYTLQQLRERARERMLAEPPDHVLVLSIDSGMRVLFQSELKETVGCAVASCSPRELAANPGLAIGALVLCPPGHMPEAASLLPKDRPPVAVTYSEADEHVEMVRNLPALSLIAIASISKFFLETARGVLAPVVGDRHAMREHLLTAKSAVDVGPADFVLCDSITYRVIRPQRKKAQVVQYRLISSGCLDYVASAIQAPAGDAS